MSYIRDLRLPVQHTTQTARICAVLNIDPGNIPLNTLRVGLTHSGKNAVPREPALRPISGRFDYVILICPTVAYNKTLYRFTERDPRLFAIICEQHKVEFRLKVVSIFLKAPTLSLSLMTMQPQKT